jgi:hypothetical protein
MHDTAPVAAMIDSQAAAIVTCTLKSTASENCTNRLYPP